MRKESLGKKKIKAITKRERGGERDRDLSMKEELGTDWLAQPYHTAFLYIYSGKVMSLMTHFFLFLF